MTTISSLYSSSAITSLLYGNNSTQEASESALLDNNSSNTVKNTSQKGYATYASSSSISLSDGAKGALTQAISDLNSMGVYSINYNTVNAYATKMQESFDTQMRSALSSYGVPADTEFQLVASKDGTVSVQCENADAKALIEKYLAEHEDVEEQFLYIQALSNLERGAFGAGSSASLNNLRGNIQANSIEAFFQGMEESGSGYSSLLADFSNSNTNFTLGANYKV